MADWKVLLSIILSIFTGISYGNDPQPEQIRISSTGNPTEMMITWTTLTLTPYSIVEYNMVGEEIFNKKAKGFVTKFTDGGSEKRVEFIHRVKLTGLTPDKRYEYHCGGSDGWSGIYMFNTMKEGVDWSPRLALYGDLGVVNAKSLSHLQQEVQRGQLDAILHVGDFAYDMYEDNARVGDDFLNQVQTIAAYVPYMTCPGNHEQHYNFSNYKNRFTMPGNADSMFYSWNIGPMHIISISTEFYFYLQYGLEQIVTQYTWLEKDLQEAASPANRTLRPWILVMGHRPMYCSNSDGDDCTHHESVTRLGITSKHLFGLEKLFYKYGVDLLIWAHEHSYERLFPLFNRQMCNGSLEAPYTNPCAPVHIITGSGGCREHHDPFRKVYGPWTAFRAEDYGYTHMNVYNKTHIHFEQLSMDKGGQVIDKMWLIKEVHGPEAWFKAKK